MSDKKKIKQQQRSTNARVARDSKREMSTEYLEAPVAIGRSSKTGNRRPMSRRMRGSEYVADYTAGSVSNVFSGLSYEINPGLAATFPRLSVEASVWEQYRVYALRVRVVPTVATSTNGSLILSPDYDSNDRNQVTEREALNAADSVQGNIWMEVACELDVAAIHASGPRKYIRSSNVPWGKIDYDAARVHVASTTTTANLLVGKVWIDYDIEFFKPVYLSSLDNSPTTMAMFGSTTNQNLTTGTATKVLFPTLVTNPLIIVDTASSYVLPRGCYHVIVCVTVADDTSEGFQGLVEILQDGAALTPVRASTLVYNESKSATNLTAVVQAILTSTGTNAFTVSATLTGAAGILSLPGNGTTGSRTITFRPV